MRGERFHACGCAVERRHKGVNKLCRRATGTSFEHVQFGVEFGGFSSRFGRDAGYVLAFLDKRFKSCGSFG